ncbi:MAG: hypothetical protein V3T59_05915 [Desulfobacterales bacterium]
MKGKFLSFSLKIRLHLHKSAASRRTLQIVPTMSSEVQTLVNRNIFMTTGIYYSCSKTKRRLPP